MRLLALALGLVAACSFPTKHFTGGGDGGGGGGGGGGGDGGGGDARMADGPAGDAGSAFACAGQQFPTTAPATITLSGKVTNAMGQPPPQQMMVIGVDATTGNSFASQLTDASGVFDMQVSTNARAIDGFFQVNGIFGSTELPGMYYPNQPFHADLANIPLEVFDPNTVQQLYSAAGLSWDNSSATMLFEIEDCNGNPVAGAQLKPNLSGPQPQAIRYVSAGGVDPSQLMTGSNGEAIAFGQPPNGASYTAVGPGGVMFHTYSYQPLSRSVVIAYIQP